MSDFLSEAKYKWLTWRSTSKLYRKIKGTTQIDRKNLLTVVFTKAMMKLMFGKGGSGILKLKMDQ